MFSRVSAHTLYQLKNGMLQYWSCCRTYQFRPYWIEKFNAVASQFTSLQKEISLVLGSAVVEPVIAAGNIDHSTFIFLMC